MKVNWTVRLKNKMFWVTLIPALIVLVQVVLRLFGITIDLGELENQLLDIINAAFILLSIVGVVNDPTTAGVSDSEQAMTYEKPKE